ncbi:MAG: VUT family protein, partial [Promethearchaeota archaeon]
MWLILLVWFITIFISTIFISHYIKTQQKEDVAIAFYVLYITISQIIAAKIGDFSIGTFLITAPVAVLIFPFTFQITDMVNENFGRKKTHRMI